MSDNDTLIRARLAEKIKKLLALGTSPNENEAAAAVAKAQSLMFAYNISLEDLIEHKASEVGERVTEINMLVTWQTRLATTVASSSLCGIFVIDRARIIGGRYTVKRDRVVVFVGRDHDAELAELILSWLMGELNRLSNRYAENLVYDTPAARKVARRSWLEGTAATVAARLMEDFSARQSAAGGSALVVHRSADIQAYLAKKGLVHNRKATSSVRKQDWEAYAQGREAGKSVALRPGQRG
jgi:hypothetical protein